MTFAWPPTRMPGMRSLSRRDFSRLVAVSPLLARGMSSPGALPARPLGKIDFQAGILGFGAQRVGEDRSDQSTVDRIVGEGLESGLNYIDTAPNYGFSEERLGRALRGKRDRVFLVSKIETRTRGEALGQIRDSLRKLQTDYLDGVLFHNIGREDRFPDFDELLSANGALGGLLEARKQGMIRHLGCSTHTNPARVLRAFQTAEFALLMCPLNFAARHLYALEEKLLPEARRRNIAVIAMKPLGGPVGRSVGARLGSREDYRATLRYVWGIPGVAVAIIGLRTPEELRQALAAAASFRPLEASELKALAERGKVLAAQWGPLHGPPI